MSTQFRSPDIRSSDPASVLGLETFTDDAALRARYLELVKQYPPETFPVEFNTIHKAFETLSNPMEGWRQLVHAGSMNAIKAFLEQPELTMQRLPTQYLIDLGAR